jgi:dienelactone hydrolase
LRRSLWRASALTLLVFLLAGTACNDPHRVQIRLNGKTLEAVYWEPAKRLSPAVLLLAPPGQTKESWVSLGARLRQQGYGVLALELSAGGSSGDELRAAFEWMRLRKKVDAARIGLVGAGEAVNAALEFAAREPMVRLVALLSPDAKAPEVETVVRLRDYGFRPILLVSGETDATRAVSHLAEAAGGRSTVDHASDAQTTQDVLMDFLRRHL